MIRLLMGTEMATASSGEPLPDLTELDLPTGRRGIGDDREAPKQVGETVFNPSYTVEWLNFAR